MTSTVEQSIEQALATLQEASPFLGNVLKNKPVVVTEDVYTVAVSTDGKTIQISGKWVSNLTQQNLNYVMAFLALGEIYDHRGRRGDRDPKLWGMACNYMIHGTLYGMIELPKDKFDAPVDILRDPRFNPAVLTSEEIYETLLAEQATYRYTTDDIRDAVHKESKS